VTIIAPYEQAMPDQQPGLLTGAKPVPMMLFNLQQDPAEQHNVASQHPEVVARLMKQFQEMQAEIPPSIRNFK